MSRTLALASMMLVLVAGCRPRPSPEYEEAHRLFSQLYGRHLDAAYAVPEMDRVVELLHAVPERSADAPAARELLARVQAGRDQLAREEEQRRVTVREMLAAPLDDPGRPSSGHPPAVHTAGDGGGSSGAALAQALDAGPSPTDLDGGPRRSHSLAACAPDAFRVLLPFESRDTAFVSQGNDGRFTHHGASRFAFDFNVPIGTAIVAAAPGVVTQAQDRFDRSADMDPEQYNFVLLDHGNGVLTEYGHLRHHGTRVRPGQRVAQGELLGYSGDTGMSTGPHLHFAVVDASLESRPACFLDVDSGVPRAGEVVESGNAPGMALTGESHPATLPRSLFAGQHVLLESDLPLLLPDTSVEIRGKVDLPSREVLVWVRPQGVSEPSRRLVAPVDADGRFHLSLPLDGMEGIQWIGFTRVDLKGAWRGWSLRRFQVAREAAGTVR